MKNLICREAQPQDEGRIIEFQLLLAQESENLKLDPHICSKGVHAVFCNPSLGKYFVAEREGQVVASLLIIQEWSDWRNGGVWWIHSVYVVPQERGQGVFRALYEMVRAKGERREDFRGLRLYVDKTNIRAQEVYRKLGMTNHHYDLYEWMKR